MMHRLTFMTLGMVTAFGAVAPNAQAADLLPNLGMARIGNLQVQRPGGKQRLLRFDTVTVNVGSGAFEVRGSRDPADPNMMTVAQRIYDDTGGSRDVSTAARMQFEVGDGHHHWHIIDMEEYSLTREDGRVVAIGAKRGFCFFDNVAYRTSLPGSPTSPFYRGCGTSSDTSVATGLSVGWGDLYPAAITHQYVDITSIPSGRYRLTVTADPSRWFSEMSETDNATWVDLRFKGNSVKVLRYGPAA
jgi:hypothetical protein